MTSDFIAPKHRHCYMCLRPLPDLRWYQRIGWGLFAPKDNNRCAWKDDWDCQELWQKHGEEMQARLKEPTPDWVHQVVEEHYRNLGMEPPPRKDRPDQPEPEDVW